MSVTHSKVVVKGIGAYLPGEPVSIDEIDSYLGKIPGVEMSRYYRIIEKHAGIRYRHYALEKGTGTLLEDAAALASNAAGIALERAGVRGHELDLVVTTTTTPPYLRAGLAKDVRIRLGNEGCATYDLWGACTGIQQAITLATAGLRTGLFRKALLVGVELPSTSGLAQNYRKEKIGRHDMLLRAALGDGAGALVLEATDDPEVEDGVLFSMSGTEGTEATAFHREAGGSTLPFNEQTLHEGRHHWQHDFARMSADGKPYLIEIIQRALDGASLTLDDIDLVVPAAANFGYFKTDDYIENASPAVQALVAGVREKIFTDFSNVGNIPSAAVYVALNDLYEQGRLRPAGLLLLASLEGATWGWGASVLRWGG